jgi:beta-lactamase class C
LQSLIRYYDRYFRDSMASKGSPGAAVVIVKDSSIIYSQGFGRQSVRSLEIVDEHTLFRVGSLSKGFAGVLTGILVKEGVFDLETRVKTYYPEFKLRDRGQADRITISHILSHSTGLPYHTYSNLVERGLSIRQIVNYFPQVRLYAKEGTSYAYQNAAFSVIEEVMQGATGKSYTTLLEEKIFRPAGMVSASASFHAMQAVWNKAQPHSSTRYGWTPLNIKSAYYNTAAAGGVNASISDMGAWLKVLLGHRPEIVDSATLDMIFQPRVSSQNERKIFRRWPGSQSAWYALGWRILERGDATLVYHGGFVNGYRSEIAIDRRNGIGICILFNGPTPMASECVPAFFEHYWSLFPPGDGRPVVTAR